MELGARETEPEEEVGGRAWNGNEKGSGPLGSPCRTCRPTKFEFPQPQWGWGLRG
jgi:hypothetical protein